MDQGQSLVGERPTPGRSSLARTGGSDRALKGKSTASQEPDTGRNSKTVAFVPESERSVAGGA
jgi:hypothetical protein